MRVRELTVAYRASGAVTWDHRCRLDNPRKAYELARKFLEHECVEVMGLMLLTTRQTLLGWHELSRGTLDSVVVMPRDVLKVALLANVAAVILVHNHPSGEVEPSPDDVALTARLKAAGEIVGVSVLDHVIVGDGRYYSFKEGGQL